MGKIILNGTSYAGSGGGGGGHTIVDPNGTDMPQENKLQFTGAVNVSDDAVNGQTVVNVEGGGNYYLNTIYSTEEKKVGYWTDGKPLYQRTITYETPFNIANGSWYESSAIYPDMNIVNSDIVNSVFAHYTGAIVTIENSKLVIGNQTKNQPMNNIKYVTIQYTKSTDTPELNPQTGGVIYLPTIYSTEEREIGVYTDGKPLYQKTWNFGSAITVNSNTWTDTSISNSNIEAIVKVVGGNLFSGKISCFDGLSATADTGSVVKILQSRNLAISVRYLTLQYTKTTDTAGSGSWTPSGANAVHYSTNEQVIGTWIDGKPRYEITLSGSGSYSAGTELVVPLPTNADKVVIMGGYVDIGTDWLPLALTLGAGTGITSGVYCYPNKSTGIHIYSSAWTFSEYNVTVQYCKTTD